MNEIESIKHEVQTSEWSQQVMSWKESGLSAAAWCKRENIPSSTFFYRLRKVRKLFIDDINNSDCRFEQLPVLPAHKDNVCCSEVRIHINGLDISIATGTSEDDIATVLRAVKTAW